MGAYLVDVVEVGLHALDGDVFVRFCRLGFQYLRKGAFSFLTDETVFYM